MRHLPQNFFRFLSHFLLPTVLVFALAACGSTSNRATFYRVKQGDTLTRIAARHHQSPQNILRWNKLSGPSTLRAGQVLRVKPPLTRTATPSRTKILPITKRAQTAKYQRPSSAAKRAQPTKPQLPSASTARTPPAKRVPPSSALAAAPVIASTHTPAFALQWPTRGPLLTRFDGNANKGVNIGGKLGASIQAAKEGKVVYAGNGLRGYGNLMIIKHQNDFLTVYAHNQVLLAKEGQPVKKGQAIARMGNTDAIGQRVMLHFEVRYKGRSVDPLRYLPTP